MRNLWMLLSGTALVVGLGGLVYYVFPQRVSTDSVPTAPASPAESNVRILPAQNPLLTATKQQLERWVPTYPLRCGAILFDGVPHRPPDPAFCLHEISKRVMDATGVRLTEDEIRNDQVRTRWAKLMNGG
jgi:hypothetical protein